MTFDALAAGLAGPGHILLAALIAILVSVSELASRYGDEPGLAASSRPALLYYAVNSLAAFAALYVLHVNGVGFGITNDPVAVLWFRGFAAGTGAAALFRSSLFNVRVMDQDIAIGPASFLQILLQVVDKEVDRGRARDLSTRVAAMMRGVDFEKAAIALPAYCMALMQNLDAQEQSQMGQQIKSLLAAKEVDDRIRRLMLGLYLVKKIGVKTLEEAIKAYSAEMDAEAPRKPD